VAEMPTFPFRGAAKNSGGDIVSFASGQLWLPLFRLKKCEIVMSFLGFLQK
jgi:hypothetical protein